MNGYNPESFLTPVLAKKKPGPAVLINWMASSMVAYLTLVSSDEMPSLTERPGGKTNDVLDEILPGPSLVLSLEVKSRMETMEGIEKDLPIYVIPALFGVWHQQLLGCLEPTLNS